MSENNNQVIYEQKTEFLQGYEFCSKHSIRDFFLNLNLYKEQIEDILPSSEVNIDEFLNDKQLKDYTPDELHFLDKTTYICKVLSECMKDFLDRQQANLEKSFKKDGTE